MNKTDLLKFIDLYNLSGTIERVKVESTGKALSTTFIAEDRTLYGELTYRGIELDKGEYGIHDTAQFKKMLGVLDDEVEIEVVRLENNQAVGFSFKDKLTESFIMLADLSVIPKTPTGVVPGNVDLEISLDESFIERFIRAKDALKDVTTFTLLMNKKKTATELVIGHSDINTNRIRLEITTVGNAKLDTPVSFKADYFREILSKNRGISGAVLKVNAKGLGHVQFKTTAYDANYYLLKVTV